jgi:glyoxylase-like metal-dependent hydrolase (beta-lactamase superfamily II)
MRGGGAAGWGCPGDAARAATCILLTKVRVPAAKQFSYAPEEIARDLFCIPLPLYDGTPVNSFVAVGDGGVWLIDGGLGTEHCQATLGEGLASLGFTFKDVRGLLITHGHTDHVGAAAAIAANGGQVLAHRLETTAGRRIAFDPTWMRRNGMPADADTAGRWRPHDWPEPTRLLEDGDRLRWGNLELEVLWCPGHTRGLVCLFERNRQLLFTTDHVMRRAPAPVSVRDAADGDPLKDYLASVHKLVELPAETVLPGHGRPFGGLARRLAHIEADIHEQLAQIRRGLESGPSTAYDLLKTAKHALRDHRPLPDAYALSQLLARLRYLERLGTLVASETSEGIRYALPA